MTDRQKASALTGLILVWCAVALPVDRYLLHDHAPWFSDLLVIKNAEIVVYPGAGHGFNADYRPSYNEDAARDGWQRMREWFRQYGVA